MKKIAAMIFLILLCLSFSFSQTKREVKNRILISEDAPKIRLKFDKKFKFAGSQKFVLYERAEAEQFFFIEAENKKIKRLYMLQFENFLPGIEGAYNYNEPQSVKIGGLDFFANAEPIPNVEAALKAVPDSDIAKAAEFLKSKGFTLMNSLLYQRFVRVVSDDKRREFMMLYIEASENADVEKQKTNLQKQALKNFKILK
ncbi:MAG: hypothetical protein ACR2F2_00940 [Pyrinomonadaceae bacterium]